MGIRELIADETQMRIRGIRRRRRGKRVDRCVDDQRRDLYNFLYEPVEIYNSLPSPRVMHITRDTIFPSHPQPP